MTVIATARTRPPGTVEGGVTFVDTPTLLADRTSSPSTPPLPPQTNPELRNLHPNRTFLSRPVEDCEGCPALAGVRNLGLDDPSAGRPDSHCNSGDRRTRAGRAAAALSQFAQAGPYGRNCSAATPSRNDHTCRAGGLLRMEPSFDPFDDDWGSTLAAKRCEGCWTSPGGRA
jgi:hypothetical protein